MNTNILLAGVGGQGILTIAAILDVAAMHEGLFVKQAEVHGMSQRGGAVESHLRISDSPIYSDLIPKGKADVIISLEPMEALRYLPFLSPKGTIVSDTEPYTNIEPYPSIDAILAEIQKTGKAVFVNAQALATEIGNAKTVNIIMLGAAFQYLGLSKETIEWSIETYFAAKSQDIIAVNIRAFRKGLELCNQ